MRNLCVLATGLALLITPACQRDGGDIAEKLDSMDKKLTSIDSRLARFEGRRPSAGKRPERPRPKPGVTYSIPVDNTPFKGAADATVTVVKGYEFACGWCEKSRPLMDEILSAYPGKVKVAYKTFLVHPEVARIPAQAACAADRQGKFAKFEPAIWEGGFKKRKFDKAAMIDLAKTAGLDVDKFTADIEGSECRAAVTRDHAQLGAIGVSGTPAIYINGQWLPQRSLAAAKQIIDKELALADKRIADGSARSSYYNDWVVKKGRKKL